MRRVWHANDNPSGQSALLPVSARDLLPANHRVWEILAMVELLDLKEFVAAYRPDGLGRPPFHPKVMVGLILYCRSKGLHSGREIAAACYDDLGARIITGNRYPDRSTVDRFLKTHRRRLMALLAQTVKLAHADGLVDVSVVAGDGTKVLANAAMSATVDEAGLLAQIADLREQVATAQAAWVDQVGAEHGEARPGLFDQPPTDTDADPAGPAPPGNEAAAQAWRRLGTRQRLLHNRQAALDYLRAHPNTDLVNWQDKLDRDQARVQRGTERLDQARATAQATHERRQAAEATGAKIPGSRPASVDEHIQVRRARDALATATARAEATAANRPTTARVNTTDPHSRIMPGKHDGFDQRHNVQVLACASQIILAIGTHDNANDKRALTNLVRDARANLDAAGITDAIVAALFDSGYASEDNIEAEADLPVDLLLISVTKEARQTGRQQDGATTVPAWTSMAERLNDPDNRKLYKQRGCIIEPVFAQLFARFGRYLNFRGEDVDTELHLWAVTHNLLKIIRHRRTRPG
jgi:transposase